MKERKSDFREIWEAVGEDHPGLYVSKVSACEGEHNGVSEDDMKSFWKRYHDLKAS